MKAARQAYSAEVAPLPAADLVFVDECGVNRSLTRHFARSPQGQRAYASAPVNWGPNVSVLGAMGHTGMMAAMSIEGPTDGDVFHTFIEQLLVPELRPGQVVVMDNLGAHKVAAVRQAIESVGARLLYLPPYSPDLNPIELCWSKLKAWLRGQAARTQEALDEALTEAFQLITSQDAHGWFKYRGYCNALSC